MIGHRLRSVLRHVRDGYAVPAGGCGVDVVVSDAVADHGGARGQTGKHCLGDRREVDEHDVCPSRDRNRVGLAGNLVGEELDAPRARQLLLDGGPAECLVGDDHPLGHDACAASRADSSSPREARFRIRSRMPNSQAGASSEAVTVLTNAPS